MPSTAATKPDYANSNHANLVACLALYQHRQDQAVGIHWVSERTRGLLWYYGLVKQGQVIEFMTAYYLNETIQNKVTEINILITDGKEAKDKPEILKKIVELEKEINIAKAMLDKITASRLPE